MYRREAHKIAQTFIELKDSINAEKWTCRRFTDYCTKELGIPKLTPSLVREIVGTRDKCCEYHEWAHARPERKNEMKQKDMIEIAYQVSCIMEELAMEPTKEFHELLERIGFVDKEGSRK